MRIISFLIFWCFLFFIKISDAISETSSSVSDVIPALTESAAASKRQALDVAGALVNHGFRVRDGVWTVNLEPKHPLFLQITLFSGNEYWFAAAASVPATALKVTLYDSTGHPLKLDTWKDTMTAPGIRTAGGFVAPRSGKYFVGLELLNSKNNASADASLVYLYK